MLKNTEDTYGSVAKLLHWLIAILFIGMIIFGLILANMKDNPNLPALVALHKSIGLTLLLLVIIRLGWRFTNVQPLLPITVPRWERLASHLVHFFLYVVVFAMPITGWLMSSWKHKPVVFWGWFNAALPLKKNDILSGQFFMAHQVIAWISIGLICLHIGAALKHHYIEKNNVLKRMLPGYKPPHLFRE